MKDEKILMQVRRSKQEVLNYMQEIINRTTDDSLKTDMRVLRGYVDRFEPCNNLKATELDRKIISIINVYRDNRLHHDNILHREDGESEIKSRVYAEANKEMFNSLAVMLENMLTERKELDNFREMSKKELKAVSDFERENYLRKGKEQEQIEEKWNLNAKLMTFELERQKLFFERKVCEEKKEHIYELWENDESNADIYRDQLASIDNEIEDLSNNERIILKQIAGHKELRSMFGNLNVEQFVVDNRYAADKFKEVFKGLADKTKKLQEKRKQDEDIVDEISRDYRESRRAAVPVSGAREKDKYELEMERRRAMKMEKQLGDAAAETGAKRREEVDNG